jgi:Tfp pilus assembly PilM family ATPase
MFATPQGAVTDGEISDPEAVATTLKDNFQEPE